jgi:hypothetical protein
LSVIRHLTSGLWRDFSLSAFPWPVKSSRYFTGQYVSLSAFDFKFPWPVKFSRYFTGQRLTLSFTGQCASLAAKRRILTFDKNILRSPHGNHHF